MKNRFIGITCVGLETTALTLEYLHIPWLQWQAGIAGTARMGGPGPTPQV